MSRLTAEAVSAALSIGDEVRAVTVCFADPEDEQADVHFRDQWEAWHPNVPLITLRSLHRALSPPVVKYLRQIEADDRYQRLVVLIPEVQPATGGSGSCTTSAASSCSGRSSGARSTWSICRLRYQLATVSAHTEAAAPADE